MGSSLTKDVPTESLKDRARRFSTMEDTQLLAEALPSPFFLRALLTLSIAQTRNMVTPQDVIVDLLDLYCDELERTVFLEGDCCLLTKDAPSSWHPATKILYICPGAVNVPYEALSAALPALQSVHIPKMTDDKCLPLFQGTAAMMLRRIDLSDGDIRDTDLLLSTLSENCKNVESLDLTLFQRMREEALEELLQKWEPRSSSQGPLELPCAVRSRGTRGSPGPHRWRAQLCDVGKGCICQCCLCFFIFA